MRNFDIYKSLRYFILIISLTITFLSQAQNKTALPVEEILGTEYYVYEVKKGDSLYGIAKKHGWDINELTRLNPEASHNFSKGLKLYYPAEGQGKKTHIVKKGETIYSVARLYGVPLDRLYAENPETVKGLKVGEEIIIPIYNESNNIRQEENVTEVAAIDDNISIEIANEINEATDSLEIKLPIEKVFEGVRMALVLDDPTSKKDIDFTRGVLIALSRFKNVPYKINFKVFDGGQSVNDLSTALEIFEPNIIISTADKAFPVFLADFGNTNNVEVLNVYDLKNDLYEENPSLVQLLPPSSVYNQKVSDQIYKENKNRKLILVGDTDPNDAIAQDLLRLFGENAESMTLEEFGSIEPDIMEQILIYSYASRREDISDFLTNMETIADNNPGLDFRVAGRPSWIAMIDEYGDRYKQNYVSIPSRIWLDEESKDWKTFLEEYETLFNGVPVRSIPNFAASGYDIGVYFIPRLFGLNGQNIGYLPKINLLQGDINLSKTGSSEGYINTTSYLLQFKPAGNPEIKVIK